MHFCDADLQRSSSGSFHRHQSSVHTDPRRRQQGEQGSRENWRTVPGPKAPLLHLFSHRTPLTFTDTHIYLTWIRYSTQLLLSRDTHTDTLTHARTQTHLPYVSVSSHLITLLHLLPSHPFISISCNLTYTPPPPPPRLYLTPSRAALSISPRASRQTYASLPVRFRCVWEKRDCLMFINHLSVKEGRR